MFPTGARNANCGWYRRVAHQLRKRAPGGGTVGADPVRIGGNTSFKSRTGNFASATPWHMKATTSQQPIDRSMQPFCNRPAELLPLQPHFLSTLSSSPTVEFGNASLIPHQDANSSVEDAQGPPPLSSSCAAQSSRHGLPDGEPDTESCDNVAAPAWKQLLDVGCILIALPVLLPVLGLIALYVKWVSPGPVLFRQERVGYRGRKFVCLKFRTMVAGGGTAVHEEHCRQLIAQGLPMTKLDDQKDRRIIPCGQVLRSLGLDELPQLLNVLRGEMSLVGPRPCLPSEYAAYLPEQRRRFDTLPGLTGLWQVNGKNATTFARMIELDLKYVRNRRLPLDLRIMVRTLPVLLTEGGKALRRRLAQSKLFTLDPRRAYRSAAGGGDSGP